MLTAVDILGIRVHSGSVDNVIQHIDQRMQQNEVTRIAFLNAHLSNICSTNTDLRDCLDNFLVLNDGVGLDIARRVLHGKPFQDNLNGSDFITNYLDGTGHDLRIFLLGSREDVVAKAGETIQSRWPRHRVVGHHHGFLEETDVARLHALITERQPDLLLVGMGNPRQERWISASVPGVCDNAIAVGAWLDFVSGAIPRAPAWVRRARLEWVYRLCLEPNRLAQRYLIGNAVFLTRLCLAKMRNRPLQASSSRS